MLAEFINKHRRKKIRRGEREGETHAFILFPSNGLYSKTVFVSHMSRTWSLHRSIYKYVQEVILLNKMLIFTTYDSVSI